MSIAIKGEQMPEKCRECPCYYVEYSACNAIGGRVVMGYGTPPADCPLVELPPHGRLIDADALLAEAKSLSGPITGDGWDNWGVYALIERQKTILEAEGAKA